MARSIEKQLIYTFDASEEYLPEIRKQVGEASSEAGFDPKITMAIQIAIEEACSNVIRHAYMLGKGMIRLSMAVEPKQVVFTIIDQGKSFDFKKNEIPDLDRYIHTGRKGGLGLYLINKIMDEVDYGPVGNENHFRMVRYIRRAKSRPKKEGNGNNKGMSFKTKFALTAAASVVLIMAVVFTLLNYRIIMETRQQIFSETVNSLDGLAARLADKIILGDELQLATLVKNAAESIDDISGLTVIDTSGVIWADAQDQRLLLTQYNYPKGTSPLIMRQFQSYQSMPDSKLHMISVPIEYFGTKRGAVISSVPESAIASSIRDKQQSLLIISLSGLGLAFLIIYLVANYHSRPVSALSATLRRVGKDGSPLHEIRVNGSDEISEIARAFNEITEKFKDHHKEAHEEERRKLEMAAAEAIQQALLPKRFPDAPGCEISADYKPTKYVSGDYFDFVKVDDTHLGIVIADVAGSGIPGSLVMSMLRASIRLEARGDLSPVAVLNRVNDFVKDDVRKGMFITVFYMILDIENRTAKFASAGHNPMILYRPSENDCYLLNPPGLPMGMLLPEGVSFSERLESDEIALQCDDLLLIYTDGVTESRNSKGDNFGEDKLVNFMRNNGTLGPKEVITKLEAELEEFMGGIPNEDDITLVALKEKTLTNAVRGNGHVSHRQSIIIRSLINENPGIGLDDIYNRIKESAGGNGMEMAALKKELKRLHWRSRNSKTKFSFSRSGEEPDKLKSLPDRQGKTGAPESGRSSGVEGASAKPMTVGEKSIGLIENQILLDSLNALMRFSSDREVASLAATLAERLKKLSSIRRVPQQE